MKYFKGRRQGKILEVVISSTVNKRRSTMLHANTRSSRCGRALINNNKGGSSKSGHFCFSRHHIGNFNNISNRLLGYPRFLNTWYSIIQGGTRGNWLLDVQLCRRKLSTKARVSRCAQRNLAFSPSDHAG
jgi:hypothetical protein